MTPAPNPSAKAADNQGEQGQQGKKPQHGRVFGQKALFGGEYCLCHGVNPPLRDP